jgi:hypothetical protein
MNHRLIRRLAGMAIIAGAAALGLSSPAHADYKLFVSDGLGDTISVNGTTGVFSSTGAISGLSVTTTPLGTIVAVATIAGNQITVTSGFSKPVIGSPSNPEMDLNTQITKTGGAASTLTFSLTDTGFGNAAVRNFLATFGGTNNGATSTLKASIDGTNTEFGQPAASTVTVGPFSTPSFGGPSGTVEANFPTVTNPYSMTLMTTVALAAGASSQSSDGHILVGTPEPAAAVLALSGVPALGALWLRRRRRAAV